MRGLQGSLCKDQNKNTCCQASGGDSIEFPGLAFSADAHFESLEAQNYRQFEIQQRSSTRGPNKMSERPNISADLIWEVVRE